MKDSTGQSNALFNIELKGMVGDVLMATLTSSAKMRGG